ncbi:MAG: helix-turn-helix domain-containing protein [Ginsengibacter sp.]
MKKNNKATAAKIPASEGTAGKKKTSQRRLSTQPPPTNAEAKRLLAQRKAFEKELTNIGEIRSDGEAVEKYEPIVFSDTWYEFTQFCRMLNLHPKTVSKWLDNGWIAYSKLGRFRIINKFDFEDTMRRFRIPARA